MSSPVPPIRDLSLLLKHYSALTPSVPSLIPQPHPFPESKTLSLPQTQQWIVQNILPLDQDEEGGGGTGTGSSLNWKKNFWKRVVRGIEEGFEERKREEEESIEDEEVDSEILERMVEYLSSSSTSTSTTGGLSNRTYYWGPLDLPRNEWNFIKTREEGRMISGGTTGLRTWQACIALGNHFLIDSKIIKSCKNIIELGSGVGVLSLICARIKKKHQTGDDDDEVGKVLATDVDEKVLELLKENVELNGLEDEIQTLKLDWEVAQIASSGEETSSESNYSSRARAQAELLEWETQAFGTEDRGADLIIGADIVYDPSLTSPLAATIHWLLSRSSTSKSQAIIAGTIRNESTWESFLHQCRCRDLKIEEIELKKFEDGSGLVGAEGWEGEGIVRVVRLTL